MLLGLANTMLLLLLYGWYRHRVVAEEGVRRPTPASASRAPSLMAEPPIILHQTSLDGLDDAASSVRTQAADASEEDESGAVSPRHYV